MAQADFPRGLQALRNVNGSAPTVQALDCVTTVLYEGALAFMSSTGLVRMCTSSVMSSALAKTIVGVFAQGKAAGAASAEGSLSKVLVYTDPNQLYEIQTDDASVSTVAGSIGAVFPMVSGQANTGNATHVRSNMEIDGSGAAAAPMDNTTNAEIFQCVAIKKAIDDAAASSWRKLVVRITPRANVYVAQHLATDGAI
jgi:hypothetical protein